MLSFFPLPPSSQPVDEKAPASSPQSRAQPSIERMKHYNRFVLDTKCDGQMLSVNPHSPVNSKKDIHPGIYCFIQTDDDHNTFHLMPARTSGHHYMFGLVKKLENYNKCGIHSAGEIIVGSNNQIVATSFKTGTYRAHVEKIESNPALLGSTRLPVQSLIHWSAWEAAEKLGIFDHYFMDTNNMKSFVTTAPSLETISKLATQLSDEARKFVDILHETVIRLTDCNVTQIVGQALKM